MRVYYTHYSLQVVADQTPISLLVCNQQCSGGNVPPPIPGNKSPQRDLVEQRQWFFFLVSFLHTLVDMRSMCWRLSLGLVQASTLNLNLEPKWRWPLWNSKTAPATLSCLHPNGGMSWGLREWTFFKYQHFLAKNSVLGLASAPPCFSDRPRAHKPPEVSVSSPKGNWAEGRGFHIPTRVKWSFGSGTVTPGPSCECDITFLLRGGQNLGINCVTVRWRLAWCAVSPVTRQCRSTIVWQHVVACRVQSITVPSSRVTRQCRSHGLRRPRLSPSS